MLTTCYRLVLGAGAEYNEPDASGHLHTCKDLKRAFNVYGEPESYGLGTPVALSDVLARVGLDSALWCLRCVHPEQVTIARRIARSLALDCSLEGTELHPNHRLYDMARAEVYGYLDGTTELEELKSLRLSVWESIKGNGSLANYGLATYIMLSDVPERYALNAVMAGIKAATTDGATKGEADAQALEFRSYVKSTFADLLKSETIAESGPGELTEPTKKGRPLTNRRKILMRYYGKPGANHHSSADNDSVRQNLMKWGL